MNALTRSVTESEGGGGIQTDRQTGQTETETERALMIQHGYSPTYTLECTANVKQSNSAMFNVLFFPHQYTYEATRFRK